VTELNAVVIFYSRYGQTEALALAAGVGAIQARANVRLRKVPEIADSQTIESDTEWKQNFDRMSQEYIAPREIDLDWADVLVLAIPSDAPDEMNRYLGSLKNLTGKIAAPFASRSITHGEKDASLLALYAAAAQAGLTVVPAAPEISADPVQAVRAYVRRVAEMARALKAHSAASNSVATP
jgi:NAD(P)H dehydrogenase (quinone)